SRRRQARNHRGLEKLPRGAGVAGDDGCRTLVGEDTRLTEHVGRGDREVDGELGGQVPIGQTTNTVGTEDPAHVRRRNQRLLYCGALRAFLRPAFLRSLIRASRVSSPAFFSVGRFASTSTLLSARATPSRSAPAWPVMPPPVTRAITSKESARPVVVSASLAICWCSLFGRYSSNGLPLTVHTPVPGTMRTRATACLRRPVAEPGAMIEVISPVAVAPADSDV